MIEEISTSVGMILWVMRAVDEISTNQYDKEGGKSKAPRLLASFLSQTRNKFFYLFETGPNKHARKWNSAKRTSGLASSLLTRVVLHRRVSFPRTDKHLKFHSPKHMLLLRVLDPFFSNVYQYDQYFPRSEDAPELIFSARGNR